MSVLSALAVTAGSNGFDLLTDLALILCVAALTTVLFQRIRQPVVLGYVLAGVIVGPHLPIPLFAHEDVAHTLSELGVILLMFSLGLEFSLRRLIRIGPTAGLIAVIQCSLMLLFGYVTGVAFGWTALESLFTGAIVAISSTTIIVKAFAEQGIGGRISELVFGVLIFEDLIGILLIAILTTVGSGAALSAGDLAKTAGRLVGFIVVLLIVGMLVVPRAMRMVVRLGRKETIVVASVGLCFGFALLARAFGYSVALGAFMGGALVAESGQTHAIESATEPVRDVFAAIFFVSVGMLIDPTLVAQHWVAVLVITGVVVVGKLLSVSMGAFLAGYGIRTSVQAGMSLAQIGEFSFIIAGLGLSLGATGTFLYPVAVTVSALTTLLTPWLIRGSGRLADQVDRCLPRAIQTYAALYGSWVQGLRHARAQATAGARIRRRVGWLVLDLLVVGAIVAGASVLAPRATQWARTTLGLGVGLSRLVLGVATLALLIPFVLGAVRISRALARTLAAQALPENTGALDLAAAPRRALLVTIQLTILLVGGGPLVAILQPFYPSVPGAAVMLGFVAVLVYPLWRSAGNLHGHARAGAQVLLEALASQSSEGESPEKARALVPGLGEACIVRLQAGWPAVGLSLKQIGLRSRTGATVIAIQREPGEVLYPDADDVLRAGDLLVLTGTADSVQSARDTLQRTPA